MQLNGYCAGPVKTNYTINHCVNRLLICAIFKRLKPGFHRDVGISILKHNNKDLRLLVSSVDRAPVCRAGGLGFEPPAGPTLRVLK